MSITVPMEKGSPGLKPRKAGRTQDKAPRGSLKLLAIRVVIACLSAACGWELQGRFEGSRAAVLTPSPDCPSAAPVNFSQVYEIQPSASPAREPPSFILPHSSTDAAAAVPDDSISEKHLEHLLSQVRAHAPKHLVERCVGIVNATSMLSWGPAREDWVLFQSFFRSTSYRGGFYVDVSTGNPVKGSTTYFFDACLGWKGICVVPKARQVRSYTKHRTCQVVPACLLPRAKGKLSPCGAGAVKESNRTLQEILAEAGVGQLMLLQRKIDLVSIRLLGAAHSALRCFPFDAFDAPLWIIANRNWKRVEGMMGRAGYWTSPTLLNSVTSIFRSSGPHLGLRHSSIFVRWRQPSFWRRGPNITKQMDERAWVPPMVLGPSFRPGHPFEGAAFLPPCRAGRPCPESLPSIDTDLEFKGGRFLEGTCPRFHGMRHRLSHE